MILTLRDILARCADEIPGFDAVQDMSKLRIWTWDALRLIDSTKLGDDMTVSLPVVNHYAEMPHDLYYLYSIQSPQRCRLLGAKSRIWAACQTGCVTITYNAIPLDEQGFPLIPDICEMGVMAYIDAKYFALENKRRYYQGDTRPGAAAPAFGYEGQKMQEAKAMLGSARADLNALSPDEVNAFIHFRNGLVFRNPRLESPLL